MLKIFKKRKFNNGEINPEDILIDASNTPNFNRQQMEGTLVTVIDKKLIIILSAIFFTIILFFTYKMYIMQIYDTNKYIAVAERNRYRSSPIFPKRGAIVDRKGVLLAWNEMSSSSPIIKRNYISNSGFSNLLGYISYPKVDKTGVFWQNIYEGKDGLEKQYQDELSGQLGSHIFEVSATGEVIPGRVTKDSKDGNELKLNIDSTLQSKLYELIKVLAEDKGFHGGAGVIMNVNTGEVLSLTSYPEYMPQVAELV